MDTRKANAPAATLAAEAPDLSLNAAVSGALARLGRGTFGELVRYFLASLLALGADLGTLFIATENLGLHYVVSATLGYCVGIAVIYAISVRWVFAHRSLADRHAERLIFIVVGMVGLMLTDIVIFGLTEVAGLAYGYSKFGAAALVFAFNFGARKFALFRAPAVQAG